ncbi:hypothetical protein [Streptomyces sp. S.PB5]|uniref:hypothetical protein n=1 Tax=Streptomyces sp. S.PB5 TaxID=3020844 RepID=UPI0025AFDD48|nr:hypothetical protein [Streptomyces sp. S.PB5]MDN3023946.1 hypothetical protein [Streptomyces sp. S.PB5]
MNHSARATNHTTAPSTPLGPDREQSTPTPSTGTELVLAEVARLANELCEHLSDAPWRTAARIRELAEAALPTAGDR